MSTSLAPRCNSRHCVGDRRMASGTTPRIETRPVIPIDVPGGMVALTPSSVQSECSFITNGGTCRSVGCKQERPERGVQPSTTAVISPLCPNKFVSNNGRPLPRLSQVKLNTPKPMKSPRRYRFSGTTDLLRAGFPAGPACCLINDPNASEPQ